ncbi:hypothetical protein ACM66B_004496 [Microbotryomycetes sp. NB124-2]
MPVDWAVQRQVLPISGADSNAPTRTGVPPKRAIALKLSEHVLTRLQAVLARHKPSTPEQAAAIKGAVQIDLSETPSLVVEGVVYPLILTPEPRHSELARIGATGPKSASGTTPAAPPIEPFATVSHKASVKPGGNLAKVGQTLRETREQAEKEREGRKAVLIETAPARTASQHKRTLSDSRDQSPASSRNSSPAPPRHASRLTAVPAKLPHGHSKLANSAKAAAPVATTTKDKANGDGKSSVRDGDGDAKSQPQARTIKPSPPADAASKQQATQGGSPAESATSSSSSSSIDQSTSTGRTSLSTVGSPVAAVADSPAKSATIEDKKEDKDESSKVGAKFDADKVAEQRDSSTVEVSAPKARPRSGSWASYVIDKGGDVIKSAGNMLRSSTKRSDAPPASIPEEEATVAKKRRVSVVTDLQDSTPGSSPKVSGLPSVKIKKVSGASASSKSTRRESSSATGRASKRKERVKAERWYSSSSDEDAEGEDDVEPHQSDSTTASAAVTSAAASNSKKRPRTSSTSATTTIRSASPGKTSSISVIPTFANATVEDFESLSLRFNSLFKTYSTLHTLLTTEQENLKAGGTGEFDLDMTDSLVKKLIGMRLELGRIQEKLTTLKNKSVVSSASS